MADIPKSQDPAQRKSDKLLDKSLEDTFPASDPSSVTRSPADKRETKDAPHQNDGEDESAAPERKPG